MHLRIAFNPMHISILFFPVAQARTPVWLAPAYSCSMYLMSWPVHCLSYSCYLSHNSASFARLSQFVTSLNHIILWLKWRADSYEEIGMSIKNKSTSTNPPIT